MARHIDTDDLIEAALDGACKAVQDGLGQTDGGFAGQFWSSADREAFAVLFRPYVLFEVAVDVHRNCVAAPCDACLRWRDASLSS